MDVGSLSGTTLYIVLFAMIFTESGILIGFWLPGDTILFAAGLVAADAGADVSIYVLSVGVAVAASAGAAAGYYTGHRLGRPFLERRYASALARTEEFYRRFGAVTLVAARFVPWARTFAPVLAGAVAMPWHRFLVAVVSGAAVWGTGLILLGYAASAIPGLRDATGWLALVVVVASVLAGVGGELLRRRSARSRSARSRDAREESAPGPAVAPAADREPASDDSRPGDGPPEPIPAPASGPDPSAASVVDRKR
ncbi:DedA family protein [Frankia gtarii]|uniref:DedA family protein n=1 Tax=Frankia gtarii TaxID=2950102 RepID=UPI0021C17696|nr:DedA family protein [Frankia gtarii]